MTPEQSIRAAAVQAAATLIAPYTEEMELRPLVGEFEEYISHGHWPGGPDATGPYCMKGDDAT